MCHEQQQIKYDVTILSPKIVCMDKGNMIYEPVNCSLAVVCVPNSMDYMPYLQIPNAPHSHIRIKFYSRTNKNDHLRKTCFNEMKKSEHQVN